MDLTIAICTKLRTELSNCIDSLANEENQNFTLSIIINSDNKPAFEHPRVDHIFYEEVSGLSRARNKAVKMCSTKYLCFIDDDSYVERGFVTELFKILDSQNFTAFGGRYIPWYKYGKPKWYSDNWVSSKTLRGDIGIIKEGYFPGGVSCWEADAIKKCGGFPEELGMNAQKISYGEEVWLQKKMRENGKDLGYNPDMMIRHLVPIEKLKMSWLWKSSFAKGRDSWAFQSEMRNLLLFVKIAVKMIFKLGVDFLNELTCLIRRKTPHFKTSMLNTAIPLAYSLGRLSAFYRKI